jgi:methyl-accepting chemotaxis protein
VKFAADITAAKKKAVEDSGKLAAISRSQAVIEFAPTGEILTANENFCNAMGYSLAEIANHIGVSKSTAWRRVVASA